MKNWIKTGLAACAIALNLVVPEAASAASFIFEQTLSNDYSILGEVEGSLAGDNNTVENPVLKWWKVLDASGTSLYSVEDTSLSPYQEDVSEFTIDGSALSLSFLLTEASERLVYEVYTSESGETYETSTWYNSVYILNQENILYVSQVTLEGIPDSIADIVTDPTMAAENWNVTYANDPESVPEPSLIIGTMLAVAAGTTALKRGNQE